MNSPQRPDPRPTLYAALDTVADLADGVTVEQFNLPTPCDEYDVGLLLGHVAGAIGRIEMVGRGEPVTGRLADSSLEPGAAASIRSAADAAKAPWTDDASMARMVEVPFGVMPGAAAALAYASEMLVHAWDLATATGQQANWPSDAEVEGILAGFRQAIPATRDDTIPFADAVEIAADAPPIDRLAAYTGRRPGSAGS